MSDEFLDTPAFPTDPDADGSVMGLTKLEWASVKIAAAIISGGSAPSSSELPKQAVRIAVAVLKEVWSANDASNAGPSSGYVP